MQITLEIPDDLVAHTIPTGDGLGRAILEAYAIEGYRSRTFSEPQVGRLLGFSTPMQVHEFLKRHNIYLNYSIEDLEQDRKTLNELLGEIPLRRAG